jgi:hypothetical protein
MSEDELAEDLTYALPLENRTYYDDHVDNLLYKLVKIGAMTESMTNEIS